MARQRLIGYIRVSRIGGRNTDEWMAEPIQRDRISEWATIHDVEIVDWERDLDVSGGTMKRPGLDRALARVYGGEADGIAVASLDRFARTVHGYVEIENLTKAGKRFVSVQEGADPDSPHGEFVIGILLQVAQHVRKQLKATWNEVTRRTIARGVHFVAYVPLGFDKQDDGRLVPNAEAPHVRQVFLMRAQGAGWKQLANYLNEQDCKPARGKQWVGNTVSNIVKNRAYTGLAFHGEHVKQNAHPAIVTEAEWKAAQVRNPMAPKTESYVLSGLVRCANCRYTMKGGKYKRGKGGMPAAFYRCRKQHSQGTCEHSATVTASLIEPMVIKRFFEFVGRLDVEATESVPEIGLADAALIEARVELVDFRDDLEVRRILGREDYLDGLATRSQAVKAADEELRNALTRATGLAVPEFDSNLWLSFTNPERRKLLASAIDSVFVRSGSGAVEDRIHICWRGQAPADLPRQGGKVTAIRPFVFPGDPEAGIGMALTQDA